MAGDAMNDTLFFFPRTELSNFKIRLLKLKLRANAQAVGGKGAWGRMGVGDARHLVDCVWALS